MHQATLIRQTLQPLLNWHGAIAFLTIFLVALSQVRTVNFVRAVAFVGKAKTESNLKRLHRFFADFELNYLTPQNALR